MGASSSFINTNVFLSYSSNMDKDKLQKLKMKLETMQCKILTHEESSDLLEENVESSSLLILCIGSDIIRNYNQLKTYNIAKQQNKKIVYLFTDSNYTYNTNPELSSVFPPNDSVLYLEECYLDSTVFNIQSTLLTCI